jgi:hypothetical protein
MLDRVAKPVTEQRECGRKGRFVVVNLRLATGGRVQGRGCSRSSEPQSDTAYTYPARIGDNGGWVRCFCDSPRPLDCDVGRDLPDLGALTRAPHGEP